VVAVIRQSSKRTQDGAIVLDLQKGGMFRTNIVGSRILALLKQDFDRKEIAKVIAADFTVDPATAAAHVEQFLSQIEQCCLAAGQEEESAASDAPR
jgi:hypothetical protein